MVDGKELMLINYGTEDCSGKPYVFRVALTKPDYCFRMLWVESIKMVCGKDKMNNTWADCYTSECSCNSDECRTYYNYDKCINGSKISYQKLNYMENDYCVVSESDKDWGSLDRYRSQGALVVKREQCWEGVKLECNFLEYNFVDCQTKRILLNAYTLTMGILYTDVGNISFYFGDSNFLVQPVFNSSNSIYSNLKIIFTNNILFLLIIYIIIKIIV